MLLKRAKTKNFLRRRISLLFNCHRLVQVCNLKTKTWRKIEVCIVGWYLVLAGQDAKRQQRVACGFIKCKLI